MLPRDVLLNVLTFGTGEHCTPFFEGHDNHVKYVNHKSCITFDPRLPRQGSKIGERITWICLVADCLLFIMDNHYYFSPPFVICFGTFSKHRG